jgi:archaetidylinositol phosphate synthase
METNKFKDAKRKQTSFLAPVEKIVLTWLAGRIPSRINPDHLSLIGLAAMFMGGLFYYLSKFDPLFFHLVNLSLFINWFGDSLDGTLARYRNKQRPRYGFYVDHIIDTFGTLFLIGGLALSGYMTERIALGILIVYFMLAINSYLATYSLGTFSLSFWKFSPTEIRLLLGIGNIALIYFPHSRIMGRTYLLYDIGGIIGIAGMTLMLIVSAIRNTKALYRLERV